MIIYNVTVKIDLDAHDEWLQWMKGIHIPEVMATGKFTDHRMCKILVDDEDGVNYSIQYSCPDMPTLQEYFSAHAPALQQAHTERYKDKFVAFRTLLETV
ncbi:MAG: DUF4286 family protein [Bacteroidota bacterium]